MGFAEEFGSVFQVEPHQPVSFQRQRVWAKRIWPWIESSVGQKLPVADFTNRTLHIVASHEKANEP